MTGPTTAATPSTGAARSRNPLRDGRDKRLNRVAGPCAMVLFGVTGDLARKKLMPAIYDLANRGLLPPGFALVGFGRRDWSDQEFAAVVHDAVRQHARTPFREDVWRNLAEGVRFVPGAFDDAAAFTVLSDTLKQLDDQRGTGGNHAFYLSIPPKFFPVAVERLEECGLSQSGGRAVAPGGHREALRARPGLGPGAERRGRAGLPPRRGLPHRPLPGQGDGAEPPGAALRQRDVRAAVERPARRPRADHHGRGHRHRRARGVLRRHRGRARRHPEPPAAAARADRHGGAGLLHRRGPAGGEGEGALRGAHPRRHRRPTPRAGSTRPAGRAPSR